VTRKFKFTLHWQAPNFDYRSSMTESDFLTSRDQRDSGFI